MSTDMWLYGYDWLVVPNGQTEVCGGYYCFVNLCLVQSVSEFTGRRRVVSVCVLYSAGPSFKIGDPLYWMKLCTFVQWLQQNRDQECTNSGSQVARATKFCRMAPNICASSVRNWLHVTVLALRILRWLLDFCKICASLIWTFPSNYAAAFRILSDSFTPVTPTFDSETLTL
jgi:hypothetical protein